mgnify:CR=1 FL=1
MPSIFDQPDPLRPQPAADPPQALGEHLQRIEADQSRRAAHRAEQARLSQERSDLANNLLDRLSRQVSELVRDRAYPRALEIHSIRYGIPGLGTIAPIRVQTGRVLTLMSTELPGWPWDRATDRRWIRSTAWAVDEAVALHGCTFAVDGNGLSSLKLAGPRIPPGNRYAKSRIRFARAVEAAVSRQGCTAAVTSVYPIRAYGDPQQDSEGREESTFFVNRLGTFVYGTSQSTTPAEEAFARMIS